MSHIIETRRVGGRKRASESVLWRNASEVAQNLPDFHSLQVAHIASHFAVSPALARVVAELAFAKGGRR